MFVLDMIAAVIGVECRYTYSLCQSCQSILRRANPLPAMIDECAVAGRSCAGAPAHPVTRLHHHNIDASRCERASRRETGQARADNDHVGLSGGFTRGIRSMVAHMILCHLSRRAAARVALTMIRREH